MGNGASVGIAQATGAASVEELRTALSELPADAKAKLRAALDAPAESIAGNGNKDWFVPDESQMPPLNTKPADNSEAPRVRHRRSSTSNGRVGGQRRAIINKLFALIDEKGRGSVDESEAQPLLISIFGEENGKRFWKEMIERCDSDGNQRIDETEFTEYYLAHVCKTMNRDETVSHLVHELERFQQKLMYRLNLNFTQ
mmetsp:Transcript_53977/g.148899  ORF Transcript_53977/g.148899 Transcript_53977/m.148899 type:complete len:199 (+) Transcript_53977:128-724(+)